MRSPRLQAGFTLIELLATLAIISILAALALAAINSLQAYGDRSKAIANMRAIGSAIKLYATDKESLLPGPLWPGQIAELDPTIEGRLARELAPYLGIETPAQPELIELFMPPAYRKVTAPAALSTSRTYVMNMKVASGNATINPWGSKAPNNLSGPLRLGSVPANAWGFSDADRQHPRVAGASWAANTPAEPIHKKRLAWFFNGSVSPVETSDLQYPVQ
jgi:prepilin-type N-terminal cleavage/methylation domain-containing protein